MLINLLAFSSRVRCLPEAAYQPQGGEGRASIIIIMISAVTLGTVRALEGSFRKQRRRLWTAGLRMMR